MMNLLLVIAAIGAGQPPLVESPPPLIVNTLVGDPPPLIVNRLTGVVWYTENNYADAVAERDATGKSVVVIFTDPVSCVYCKQLEKECLNNNLVKAELSEFICIKVDTTTKAGAALAVQFGEVTSVPQTRIYKNNELVGHLNGSASAAGFVNLLGCARAKSTSKNLDVKAAIIQYKAKDSFHYNPEHQCDVCGTSQYVINQRSGSMHSHKCPKCKNEWWHSNQ